MAFVITYKASYLDVDVFYPYEGWDDDCEVIEEEEDDAKMKEVIAQLMFMEDERIDSSYEAFHEVAETIEDGWWMSGCDIWWDSGCIKVEEAAIYGKILFEDDNHAFDEDMPELVDVIPTMINADFCIVKCCENSGQLRCEGEGNFDINQIRYCKGKLFYGNEEFYFTDGDGMSSYVEVYKNGVMVDY